MGLLGPAQTTDPGQRMVKTYGELQTWKRQLVKADTQLRSFETATQQLASMLDVTLHTFPRVWQHTTLGANDAHLPPDTASLPVPGTAPTGLPSAEITKGMVAQLQEETHVPLDAWHKRYGELKAAMVPLEGSRKHYEQACADLMKAQAYQRKLSGKKGPAAAAALDGGIAEKEALRQERWGKYLELEEQTYQKAAQLAVDAKQAQGFFSAGMAAVSAAFAALSQQYASGGPGANGQMVVARKTAVASPTSPQGGWARTSGGGVPPSGENGDYLASSHNSFSSAHSNTPPPPVKSPGRAAPPQQQAQRKQQQQQQQQPAGAAGGPITAGPTIAAADLPLQQQAGQPPTLPGSPPGPQPPQQQYQAKLHATHRPSASVGTLPTRDGSAAASSAATAGAVALSQGDLPLGANMVRADSAPSPDGPPTSGYIRPAKLPARLPARQSSYKGGSGPDLPRAAGGPAAGPALVGGGGARASAGEGHSRRASEASEASLVEAPNSPTSVTSSTEMDGPRRYMPSYLRNSTGPHAF